MFQTGQRVLIKNPKTVIAQLDAQLSGASAIVISPDAMGSGVFLMLDKPVGNGVRMLKEFSLGSDDLSPLALDGLLVLRVAIDLQCEAMKEGPARDCAELYLEDISRQISFIDALDFEHVDDDHYGSVGESHSYDIKLGVCGSAYSLSCCTGGQINNNESTPLSTGSLGECIVFANNHNKENHEKV